MVYEGICSECETPFSSNHPRKKTCTTECSAARERRMSIKRSAEFYANNKDRWVTYRKAHAEELATRQRAYYQRTRTERLRYSTRARSEKKARYNELSRQHYRENSEDYKRRAKLRKSKIRSDGQTYLVTPRDIARLLIRYRYECAYCSTSIRDSYHLDHVLPLKRGGVHCVGNLVPSCPPCNLSKGSKLLTEWRALQRKLAA